MILQQNYKRRTWYIVPLEAKDGYGGFSQYSFKWQNRKMYEWLVESVHKTAWDIGYIPLSKSNAEAVKLMGLPMHKITWIRFVKYTDAVNFLFSICEFG